MKLTTELSALEASAQQASSWHEISPPLRRLASSTDDASFILASAFDYILNVDRPRGTGQRHTTFEPMLRLPDGETVPPSLETVSTEWLEIWEAAASEVSAPAARSRLHDLLAESQHGNVLGHARAAIAAYRELARAEWDALDRADALVRALELARRFALETEHVDVLAETTQAAAASLGASEPEPAVALLLLRTLANDPECPAEVDQLLTEAKARYHGAHVTESVIEIQRQRAAGDEVTLRNLARDRVQAWLDEAEGSSGLVRMVHLETAARLARDAGVKELYEVAQRRLQAIPKEDLRLQEVSAETQIPEEVVAEYLAPFKQARSVRDALVALISHPPATGDVTENRKAMERSRTEFPLQHLFPRARLGGDSLVRWTPTTDGERDDIDLAEQETLRFQVLSGLLARGLWEAGDHLKPSREDVEAFLMTLPNRPQGAERLLSEALVAYWRQEWTASLFLALPCVEALCRNLVLALEKGIYQTQRGRRPGQYPGLAVLLGWLLDEGLDESWFRYAWTILASPSGLNLRNEVAHGFVYEVGPQYPLAVLHISLYLAALRVGRVRENDGEA